MYYKTVMSKVEGDTTSHHPSNSGGLCKGKGTPL